VERSFHIVKSALELSALLGMSTIAEGIEDAQTAEVLLRMGCTFAQGFHFARPMLLDDLRPWLQAQATATTHRAG